MKSIVINKIFSTLLLTGVAVFWICSLCSSTFNPFTKTVECVRILEKKTVDIGRCSNTCSHGHHLVEEIVWEGKSDGEWQTYKDKVDIGSGNVYDSFYTLGDIESGKVDRVLIGRVLLFILVILPSIATYWAASFTSDSRFYDYTNTKFTKDIKFLSTALIFFGYDKNIIERTVNNLLERSKNQIYLIYSVNDVEEMFWEEYNKQKDIT